MAHTPREQTFVEKRQGDTLINALIGAVASIVLSFTGVGIILGGGVAGYLQGEGGSGGAKVGALSGLIAAIPAFLFVTFVFGGLGIAGMGAGEFRFGALFGGFMLFIIVVVVLVMVGMGALGGLIGGLINDQESTPAQQYGRDQRAQRGGGRNQGGWNQGNQPRGGQNRGGRDQGQQPQGGRNQGWDEGGAYDDRNQDQNQDEGNWGTDDRDTDSRY